MRTIKKSTLITLGIILGTTFVYLTYEPFHQLVKHVIFIMSMLNEDVIKDYIHSFGLWAPIISFLLMIFQSIIAPIPAFMITFANAAVFGWVQGATLSWTSAMVGATLCFYISRFLGRGFVERLTSKNALKSIDGFFDRYGKYAILIARLLPFVSFDIVSYAAGFTSMGFWSFFWATGIGQLPATIVYSYVGGMLVGSAKRFVFGLLILFAFSVLIFMLKKIWNDKNKRIIG